MGDLEKVAYVVIRESEDSEGVRYSAYRKDGNPLPNHSYYQTIDAFSAEEAIVLARRPREDGPRVFTAEEMVATVKAVEKAHRGGETIMGHIRAQRDIDPASADAIREIVVTAYHELRIGE